jgi:hypothetical protein
MPCDICSLKSSTTMVPAKIMSRAIRAGFDPFRAGLIPPSLAHLVNASSPDEWKRHAIKGLLSQTQWNLCSTCHAKAIR